MAKVRVSTLAKEFGMTSKELMGHLADMKIPAKSASSALEDAYVAMVRKQLAPVIEARAQEVEAAKQAEEQAAAADLVLKTRAVSTEAAMEEERFTCLRGHTVGLNAALSALEQQLAALRAAADAHTAARIARDGVVPAMQACREHCDALERMLNAAAWPLPSYAEMLWLH